MFATSPRASRISSSVVVFSSTSNIVAATLRASPSAQLTKTVPSHPPEIWTDADRCLVPFVSAGALLAWTGNPSIEVQMSLTI